MNRVSTSLPYSATPESTSGVAVTSGCGSGDGVTVAGAWRRNDFW
nr:hypothetical protein [Nostoc sp. ChiQUE02]MDZ8234432.1 hypothetical protein [Nostoc sp. ChiQUE02]